MLLVGCEPTPLDPDEDFAPGLSEPVQAAVDGAVDLIESLVNQIRATDRVAVTESVTDPVPLKGDHDMKALETLAGAVVAVVSVFILAGRVQLFAFGSIGRYMKAKSM